MDTLRPREFDEIAALEQPSIVASMWRYRWLVALIVAIFIGLGLAFQAYVPSAFQATAEMVVEDPRASQLFNVGEIVTGGQNPQRYVADQVEILQSPRVAAQAEKLVTTWASTGSEALGEDWPGWLSDADIAGVSIPQDEFLSSLSISSSRDSNQIEVSFTADTATRARVGANAIVEAYQDVRFEQLEQTANAAVLQIGLQESELEKILEDIQLEIDNLIALDAVRSGLDDEFEDDLATFLALQLRLDALDPTSEAADTVRIQLDDLLQDFQTTAVIDTIEAGNAELQALIAQQDAGIAELAALSGRSNSILIDLELTGTGVTSLSLAPTPTTTTGSGPARILAAAIVLGLAVAAALSYFLASRRRAFGSRTLPELVLNAPLLAEVPDFTLEGIKSSLPVTQAPTSASAEAFRFAAAAVDIRASAAGAKSLMMVSATLASGKTTAAANTAIAAAREGLRVLVIDADFGNQELTSMFLGEEQPAAGITEVVAGVVPLEQAVRQVVVTDDRSLYLLWRGRQPVEAANFFRTED
ncbi:MAG: hypothetical protein HKM97_09060, partial [Acidimicrobiia bacterium]|nr:hypothetical protein [Acidimicrobiia bacterium]